MQQSQCFNIAMGWQVPTHHSPIASLRPNTYSFLILRSEGDVRFARYLRVGIILYLLLEMLIVPDPI